MSFLSSEKVCLRPNYVPVEVRVKPEFKIWKKEYFDYLVAMFDRVENILKSRVEYKEKMIFNDFCLFLYDNSSGYIESQKY